MSEDILVLVDGSSFMFRAYYAAAHQKFSSHSGQPTGAVMIFTSMLRRLLNDFPDSPVIVFFDAGGLTFRKHLYPAYKANRPPLPEDLRSQISWIRKIVEAYGLPVVCEPGFEADDYIASYARHAEENGYRVLICSGDKDLAQLVSNKIMLFDTMQDKRMGVGSVMDKFGVEPHCIPDYLALVGDKADNVPGMPGTGPATAAVIVNLYGGLAEIMMHLDEMHALNLRGAKTFAQRFTDNLPQILLSYRLVKLKSKLKLGINYRKLRPPKPNYNLLLEIFDALDLQQLSIEVRLKLGGHDLREIEENRPAYLKGRSLGVGTAAKLLEECQEQAGSLLPADDSSPESCGTAESFKRQLVLSSEELKSMAADLKAAGLFAFDVKTDDSVSWQLPVVFITFAVNGCCWAVPLGFTYLGSPEQPSVHKVKEILGPLFADESVKKSAYDLKFNILALRKLGLEVRGLHSDVRILAHLDNSLNPQDLESLAQKELSYPLPSYHRLIGRGARQLPLSSVDYQETLYIASREIEAVYRLQELLEKRLADTAPDQIRILREIEMPFLRALANMQGNGATLDIEVLKQQSFNLKQELSMVANEIYSSAGEIFNIQSPKQLGNILFNKLNIPYPRKAKIGHDGKPSYSTAEEILQDIAPQYDIAYLVLRHRTLSKLITTYTDKLPELVVDGRIYTTFNQTGTNTGRLSSADPNLQNIPARTPEGRQIRKAFTAPRGCKIISADYSQIELRLIAHFSEDPNLVQAFRDGADIHRHTAAQVLGKSPEDVTPEERSGAKATNFGLMYGISPHGLARMTHMSYREAKDYIAAYFTQYAAVKRYMDEVKEQAAKQGYISTLEGRRISFSGGGTAFQRMAIERQAINAPMQGSAADIIKRAMIAIDRWIATLEPGAVRMTLQVHDELVFEVRDDFVDEAKAQIAKLMSSAVELLVPLEVGIGAAGNWADAH